MNICAAIGQAGLLLTMIAGAGSAPAAEIAGDCLRVKGWETLPETGRLCAYLADTDASQECERRGHRLDDRVATDRVAAVQQYLLLCQDEFVIEVGPGQGSDTAVGTLSITTAILETSGELQGEYTHGRVFRMAPDGAGWREIDIGRWKNYQGAEAGR